MCSKVGIKTSALSKLFSDIRTYKPMYVHESELHGCIAMYAYFLSAKLSMNVGMYKIYTYVFWGSTTAIVYIKNVGGFRLPEWSDMLSNDYDIFLTH
jgi:hypothetical protein